MVFASGKDIIMAITHNVNCVVAVGKITNDRSLSNKINNYTDREDALLKRNYWSPTPLDQVMKVVERILVSTMRNQADIDAIKFGFMPWCGTSAANFILGQVHEMYLGKHKDLYFAFVGLEKAFDRVSKDGL